MNTNHVDILEHDPRKKELVCCYFCRFCKFDFRLSDTELPVVGEEFHPAIVADGVMGDCQRNPPQLLPRPKRSDGAYSVADDNEKYYVHPQVNVTLDWCGEFQPRT